MSLTTAAKKRDMSDPMLAIDPAVEADRIASLLRTQVQTTLRKRGLVLGLSGGIDSSLCAALAVRAVGPKNVFCLLMPENDSDPDSLRLGKLVAETYGIRSKVEDIGSSLDAMGCYTRRNELIRDIVPEYGEDWSCKVVIANGAEGSGYNFFSLVVESPEGETRRVRMPPAAYLGIVAATNMKQRTRKMMEYFHAERLNYAVIGTPNRLEYDQGFFVKYGDGAADVKPIAHLYKTQVYELAAYLGVPDEILRRPPTTDTWSLAQTQEEFYFALPYDQMDLCLYGLNHSIPAAKVAAAAGLSAAVVENVWRDIIAKRKATQYLHMKPLLAGEVGEI
ncbi:NAD(+) synthase [Microvirga mediterraneensis]|uniref:NH(3)-dependent NAD(+) synthetase n=1 Tax=Microvirga mediterraneensis TaxID=2754695 RepID=A0A838BQ27_9HYPH|nr:NAD(+) synthase [Microvirga mediterraneensis]MBA1157022.1 NAD(+) synthase [Microvirga mediterraneensis]